MTSFRNVDVDPSRPLDEWPAEAIEILIDRGMRSDWAWLIVAIEANPWGTASRTAENVASASTCSSSTRWRSPAARATTGLAGSTRRGSAGCTRRLG